jgi:2,3-bisphosphoglycerate-independent phosphoglycerate mutase
VPLIFIGDKAQSLRPGRLSDIAPTMLDILNIDKPVEMTGKSLLEK